MKKVDIKIDGEEYVGLSHLRSMLRSPDLVEVFFGENKRHPLALELHLAYDVGGEKPTITLDLGKIVRDQINPENMECGYEGWPNVKATRDALVRLVAYMDRWDAKCRDAA